MLFAPAAELAPVIEAAGLPGIELVDAPRSIAKDPDPARAIRQVPDASIVQAVHAVADGRAQAFRRRWGHRRRAGRRYGDPRRADGIRRPAIAAPISAARAEVVVLDVGANATVRPEHLEQFAFMGRAFAQLVLGVEQPRVALLSNGEEESRGTDLVREVHQRLAGHDGLGFIGNIDGQAFRPASRMWS